MASQIRPPRFTAPYTVRGMDMSASTDLVQVDDKASRIVQEILDQAAPGLNQAIEAEVVSRVQRAKDRWPVRSGVSRESISMEYYTLGGTFVTEIKVGAEYAGFIKFADTDINVAKALLFDPIETAADRLLEAIAAGLVD